MSVSVPALSISNLKKSFDKPVISQLNLTVRQGEFYALLGPNGAGKTTLLRMVSGILTQDEGKIEICGYDTKTQSIEARHITAWVSDEPMVYNRLTPFEYLDFIAGLWQIEANTAHIRAEELLGKLDMLEHANTPCGGFSKGMLQKVALAGALVHQPRLLMLDEPLTGLDAGSAHKVKDLLLDHVANGVTIIMTTHILDVAERMAERIGVLAGGSLVAEGSMAELHKLTGHEGASLENIFLELVKDADETAGADTP